MFDIFLYPLHFSAGREQTSLPGLFAAAPPRRCERHRSGDMLAVLFTCAAGTPRDAALSECFKLLSATFFTTSGTVTTALRTAIEKLNDALLAGKIQPSSENGTPLLLNMAVLRGSVAYFAHAGQTHSLLIGKSSVQDFYDAQTAGRGLGITRAPALRLFQAEIEPGDMLIFAAQPPANWTPAEIASRPHASAETVRVHLLTPPTSNLEAALLQLQTGSGNIQQPTIAPPTAAPSTTAPTPAQTLPVAAPATPAAAVAPLPAVPAPPAAPNQTIPAAPADETPIEGIYLSGERLFEPSAARPGTARERRAAALRARPGLKDRLRSLFARKPAIPPPAFDPAREQAAEAFAPPLTPEPSPARPPTNKAWAKGAASVVRNVYTARQNVSRGLARFLPRLAPGTSAQPINLSTASLLFIAIAVPVIIVAIATTVYLQAGIGEERIAFLQQARIYADQAAAQKDAALRRNAWEQTMYWIKKAEAYGADEESQALRKKAQAALDSMDGIVRLSLVPAFSGILGSQVNISRIVTSSSDLYLLDSSQGRVLRLMLAGRSYEFDPNFSCGPGPADNKIISPLIGMAAMPLKNDKNAVILAVDAAGNVLYCRIAEPPLAATLKPPENNWGKINAMSLSDGNLHLVDIPNNGVYRYDGNGYTFGGQARPFFGNAVPALSDVLDMTTYLDDLYLLHGDGTMTVCTWSDFESMPTRCTDPASYGDARKTGAFPNFPDARFLQMTTTQPPDPSLFILDTSGPSIYHFSLRLNLQRQLRQDTLSDYPLPNKTATAFAISPTRTIFMAFGNEVFFGPLP